eukprot:1496307-Heterocapsa_arctica.AAC.1
MGADAPVIAGPVGVRRVARFLHHFAGPACPFGLGEAIEKEAARQGVAVEVTSRDIKRDGADLLAAEPWGADLEAARQGHWDGYHSGFVCSSFSRV